MIRVVVSPDDFDVSGEVERLQRLGGGGIASFIGVARGDDGVEQLRLEYYPGMTERILKDLAEQAVRRWSLLGATIVHRVGALIPGDRIVLVATAARHRSAALESCSALIDQLKTAAPFWKSERRAGQDRWVEARAADEAAAGRWTGSIS